MRPRLKPTDVCKVAVLRHQNSARFPRRTRDFVIGMAAQPFLFSSVDIMTLRGQTVNESYRKVLVQLEPHDAAIRQTFSRASSAAYAIAARMSSGLSVG